MRKFMGGCGFLHCPLGCLLLVCELQTEICHLALCAVVGRLVLLQLALQRIHPGLRSGSRVRLRRATGGLERLKLGAQIGDLGGGKALALKELRFSCAEVLLQCSFSVLGGFCGLSRCAKGSF
jgi:hypothetical protein